MGNYSFQKLGKLRGGENRDLENLFFAPISGNNIVWGNILLSTEYPDRGIVQYRYGLYPEQQQGEPIVLDSNFDPNFSINFQVSANNVLFRQEKNVVYNTKNKTQFTIPSSSVSSIYGNSVVYTDDYSKTLFLYKENTIKEIFTSTEGSIGSETISGRNIVWTANRSIYLYDIETEKTVLVWTFTSTTSTTPRHVVAMSGENVVFVDGSTFYLYRHTDNPGKPVALFSKENPVYYFDVSISDNNIIFGSTKSSATYVIDINDPSLSHKVLFSEITDPDILTDPMHRVVRDISGDAVTLAINTFSPNAPAFLATLPFTLERVGTIEGGSPIGDILPGVNSAERQVHFNLIGHSDNDPLHQRWNGKPVWIVIHGWNDNPNGNEEIARLAETVKRTIGDEGIVLTLDWSEASNVGDSDPSSLLKGDNATAASWIALVADFAAQQLKDWGLNNGNQLNLIGHSLGSFLSAEIASQFTTANTITAIDPASESNRFVSTSFDGGYDMDGSVNGIQRPRRFDEVSNFSRSFLGSRSIAGDAEFASWADESILVDYGTVGALGSEHTLIVDTYAQLIDSDPSQRRLTNDLFSLKNNLYGNLLRPNSYSSTKLSTEFKEFEGILYASLANNAIKKFTGLNPFLNYDRDTDEMIYGTNKTDRLIGNTGQDFLVGGAGRDKLYGGTDDDILFGGEGNDVLEGTPRERGVSRSYDKDLFVFEIDKNRGFNTNKIGVDVIRDFDSGIDKIVLQGQNHPGYTRDQVVKEKRVLRRKEFAQIEVSKRKSQRLAEREKAKIIFNQETGQVYSNPNGQRKGFGNDGGLFAVLQGTDNLSSRDFLV